MTDPFLARIEHTLRTQKLLPPGSRTLVAVSGGPDSMALLDALAALRITRRLILHVAHVDHQLRPESAQEAAFVRAAAERYGLPVYAERCGVREAAAQHHWSLEDAARRLRHESLKQLAARHHLPLIALAHTADDQAETVLLRLLRGTGLRGLGAMDYRRPAGEHTLIRPLLEISRAEVMAYLQRRSVAFCDDPSNQELRFTRNRIRHKLLPLLEQEYNPNIRQSLLQLAAQSRTDYTYLSQAAQRYWKRAVKLPPGRPEAIVALRTFRQQPPALQRQLLRQVVEHLRGEPALVEFRHWLEAERLFAQDPPGAVVDLPGGVRLTKEADRVVCRLVE